MGLNLSNGNMYDWVTHTWNAIKGKCPHGCIYCYMKKWGEQKPVRFDESELKTDLGKGNFIFVGSSCDMFADQIDYEWIMKTIDHCDKFDNEYLFQSKNPEAFDAIPLRLSTDKEFSLCTTIETNRTCYPLYENCPSPKHRALAFAEIPYSKMYVTIEPIVDFDLVEMLGLVLACTPIQVNIGADSGGHNLPEPSKEKIIELINELERHTKVKQKKNLQRLLK